MTPRSPHQIWQLNRAGSAVIEFALIAPILVSLLLGVFDLGPSLMIRFKATSATQTVADLASQSATMQTADVANFFGAGSDVLAPFSGSPLVMRISNIATNGIGRTFIYWSCGQGVMPPYNAATTVLTTTPTGTALPSNLLQTLPGVSGTYILNGINTSYLLVESLYTYSAPAGFIFPSPQVLKAVAFSFPRVSTYIGPTTGVVGFIPIAPILITQSVSTSSNGITCNTGI